MTKFIPSFYGLLLAISVVQIGENKVANHYADVPQVDTVLSSEKHIPSPSPSIVAERLQCVEQEISLPYHRNVHNFIDYFTIRDREYTKMVIKRASFYFPFFEPVLAKYGLPDELKYLPIIESGLNPRAVSPARAVGLWQFIPSTGRYYGLRQNFYVDERMDIQKSTDAACRYLAQLYAMFHDWPLALAAYNSGPGTVRRAIRRSGYKKSFWQVYRYLPRETRSYVPQFYAIIYTLNYAYDHNFQLTTSVSILPYDTLRLTQSTDLSVLADMTGTCLEDIHDMNPFLKKKALPQYKKGWIIKIPIHAKQNLETNRQQIMDSAVRMGKIYVAQTKTVPSHMRGRKKITHRVKWGESLGLIAQRYRLSIRQIRYMNGLRSNRIYAGQVLRLWVNPSLKRTKHRPKVSATIYVVQPGDTLWKIAQKRGVTIFQIKRLNNLRESKIQIGQRLKLG